MVKQVTKWVAQDGAEFNTEEDAINHEDFKERTKDVRNLLEENFCINSNDDLIVDVYDMVEWLMENFVKKET